MLVFGGSDTLGFGFFRAGAPSSTTPPFFVLLVELLNENILGSQTGSMCIPSSFILFRALLKVRGGVLEV